MSEAPEEVMEAYGDLPAGWRLEKLKFFAGVRNSNVDKTISEDEEPVSLCNYTDVYYNDRITPDLPFTQGSATEVEIEKFQLKAGQVIITKDSEGWDDIGIPALVSEDMPDVVCGYHLSVFEPTEELDGAYLAWLCRADPLNDQFKLGANGVTRYGLGQYPMKNAYVSVPPLDAQRRIARYLDEKTARIDGLIKKKRALLDRLAEKRQALITRAVTKGLNPDSPMKPSGIDWLCEIPAHWEVRRLKTMVSIWGRIGFRGYTVADIVDAGEGALSLSPSNIVDGEISYSTATYLSWEKYYESPEIMVSDGDLLFVKTGSTIGKVCHVGSLPEPMTINPQLVVLKPVLGLQKFIYYVMRSVYFQYQVSGQIFGGSTPAMTQHNLGSLLAVVAPVPEQRNIVTYLDRCGNESREVARCIVESINKLQEYRASLITSAVTGRIGELQ